MYVCIYLNSIVKIDLKPLLLSRYVFIAINFAQVFLYSKIRKQGNVCI